MTNTTYATSTDLAPSWATTVESDDDAPGVIFYKRDTDQGIELTQAGWLVVDQSTAVYRFDEPIIWLPHVPDDVLTVEQARRMVAALQEVLTALG